MGVAGPEEWSEYVLTFFGTHPLKKTLASENVVFLVEKGFACRVGLENDPGLRNQKKNRVREVEKKMLVRSKF
jgi:hypothetical protein